MSVINTSDSSGRDYSSFSSAAKSRFRGMAAELGFVQLSGILYARERQGWYEMFYLQSSSYGSDTFYVNTGIAVPQLCPVEEPMPLRENSFILWDRLSNTDDTGAFKSITKADISASVENVKTQMLAVAFPWFSRLNTWDAIAAEYYKISPIDENNIGSHTAVYGAGSRSAVYGYLLLKAGRKDDALRWFNEAKRILSLPTYCTQDGRLVHVKEKHARFMKPAPYEVKELERVERTLQIIVTESE